MFDKYTTSKSGMLVIDYIKETTCITSNINYPKPINITDPKSRYHTQKDREPL